MSIVTYNNRSIRNISAIPGAAESLTHIKTVTASSDSTINFVDGSSDVVLDSTHPIYLFKFINIFKAFHNEADSSTGVSYDTNNDLANSTSFQQLNLDADLGADNDQSLSGELYLFNPSSTTFVKHFMGTSNFSHAGDFTVECFFSGYFNTTSAIDAIQFKMNSNNIDSGTIKLYGIKDS